MQRLQHIFHRAALALALLTAGIGGGYGLYQPQLASGDAACVSAAPTATAAGTRAYVLVETTGSESGTDAQAACRCDNA